MATFLNEEFFSSDLPGELAKLNTELDKLKSTIAAFKSDNIKDLKTALAELKKTPVSDEKSEKQISALEKKVDQLTAALKRRTKAEKEVGNVQSRGKKELTALEQKYKQLQAALIEANKQADIFPAKQKRIAHQIRQTKKDIDDWRASVRGTASTLNTLNDTYGKSKANLNKLRKELDDVNLSTDKQSAKQKQLVKEYNKARRAVQGFERSIGDQRRSVGKYTNSLNNLNQILLKFGLQMQLLMFVGNLLRRGFDKSVGAVVKFEQAVVNLASILGKTREDIKSLESSALSLANTTIFTAEAIAKLQTELSKLGFSQGEILDSTRAILDFAVAAQQELAPAAKLIGSVLRSFGLDAAQTGRITDTLSKSFTKSALNAEDFTEAIKFVAPIAKTANVSIEETASLLGVLADAGLRGSIAGTALKNTLVQLSRPTSKAVEQLGIQVGSAFDLSRALDVLAEKQLSLGQASQLFDERARPAVLTLAKNIDRVRALSFELELAGGTTEKLADQQLETLNSKLEIFGANIESVAIGLGNTSIIKDWFDVANNKLSTFSNLLQLVSSETKEETFVSNLNAELEEFGGLLSKSEKTLNEFLALNEKLIKLRSGGLTGDASQDEDRLLQSRALVSAIKAKPGFSSAQFTKDEDGFLFLEDKKIKELLELREQKQKSLFIEKKRELEVIKDKQLLLKEELALEKIILQEKAAATLSSSSTSREEQFRLDKEFKSQEFTVKSLEREYESFDRTINEFLTKFPKLKDVVVESTAAFSLMKQSLEDIDKSLNIVNSIEVENLLMASKLREEEMRVAKLNISNQEKENKLAKTKLKLQEDFVNTIQGGKFSQKLEDLRVILREEGFNESDISSAEQLQSFVSEDARFNGLSKSAQDKISQTGLSTDIKAISQALSGTGLLDLDKIKLNLKIQEDLASKSFERRTRNLRKFLQEGSVTEEFYNELSLRSEIEFLEDRIAANKNFGGEFLGLEKQLMDKRVDLIQAANSTMLSDFKNTFSSIEQLIKVSGDSLNASLSQVLSNTKILDSKGNLLGFSNDPRELKVQIESGKERLKILKEAFKVQKKSVISSTVKDFSLLTGRTQKQGKQLIGQDLLSSNDPVERIKAITQIEGDLRSISLDPKRTEAEKVQAGLLLDNLESILKVKSDITNQERELLDLKLSAQTRGVDIEAEIKQIKELERQLMSLEQIQGFKSGTIAPSTQLFGDFQNLFISASEFFKILKSGKDITLDFSRKLNEEQERRILIQEDINIERQQGILAAKIANKASGDEIASAQRLLDLLIAQSNVRRKGLELSKIQESQRELLRLLPEGESPLNTFLQGKAAIDRFFGEVEKKAEDVQMKILKAQQNILLLPEGSSAADKLKEEIVELRKELELLQDVADRVTLKELQNSFKFLNSFLDKPAPQAFIQGLIDRSQIAEQRIGNLLTRLEDSERPDRREEIINEIEALKRQLNFEYLLTFTETYRKSFADSGNVGKALGDAAQAVGAIAIQRQAAKGQLGFYEGGYTGDVGTKQEAGVVHGQEFVISAPWTKKLGLKGKSMSEFANMVKENNINISQVHADSASKIPNFTANNIVKSDIDYDKLSDAIASKMPSTDLKNIGGHIMAIKKQGQKSINTIIKDPSHFPITRNHNKI